MESKEIYQRLTQCGIPATPELAQGLAAYHRLLMDWNTRMDLTAVTEEAEMLDRHYVDALSPLARPGLLPQTGTLIDVGTGAGFPGIPLKILRPDVELTLLDSLNKRLTFLGEVCAALGLESRRVHKRAEEAGLDKAMRESYDLAVARAVAPLNILCEYCLPLVKMKGFFVAMKGPGGEQELQDAAHALEVLGDTDVRVEKIALPEAGERDLIVVQKKRFTPKGYPRHGGTIAKHPL